MSESSSDEEDQLWNTNINHGTQTSVNEDNEFFKNLFYEDHQHQYRGIGVGRRSSSVDPDPYSIRAISSEGSKPVGSPTFLRKKMLLKGIEGSEPCTNCDQVHPGTRCPRPLRQKRHITRTQSVGANWLKATLMAERSGATSTRSDISTVESDNESTPSACHSATKSGITAASAPSKMSAARPRVSAKRSEASTIQSRVATARSEASTYRPKTAHSVALSAKSGGSLVRSAAASTASHAKSSTFDKSKRANSQSRKDSIISKIRQHFERDDYEDDVFQARYREQYTAQCYQPPLNATRMVWSNEVPRCATPETLPVHTWTEVVVKQTMDGFLWVQNTMSLFVLEQIHAVCFHAIDTGPPDLKIGNYCLVGFTGSWHRALILKPEYPPRVRYIDACEEFEVQYPYSLIKMPDNLSVIPAMGFGIYCEKLRKNQFNPEIGSTVYIQPLFYVEMGLLYNDKMLVVNVKKVAKIPQLLRYDMYYRVNYFFNKVRPTTPFQVKTMLHEVARVSMHTFLNDDEYLVKLPFEVNEEPTEPDEEVVVAEDSSDEDFTIKEKDSIEQLYPDPFSVAMRGAPSFVSGPHPELAIVKGSRFIPVRAATSSSRAFRTGALLSGASSTSSDFRSFQVREHVINEEDELPEEALNTMQDDGLWSPQDSDTDSLFLKKDKAELRANKVPARKVYGRKDKGLPVKKPDDAATRASLVALARKTYGQKKELSKFQKPAHASSPRAHEDASSVSVRKERESPIKPDDACLRASQVTLTRKTFAHKEGTPIFKTPDFPSRSHEDATARYGTSARKERDSPVKKPDGTRSRVAIEREAYADKRANKDSRSLLRKTSECGLKKSAEAQFLATSSTCQQKEVSKKSEVESQQRSSSSKDCCGEASLQKSPSSEEQKPQEKILDFYEEAPLQQSLYRGKELATLASPILGSSTKAESREKRRWAALQASQSKEEHKSPPLSPDVGQRRPSMDFRWDAQSTSRGEELATQLSPILGSSGIAQRRRAALRASQSREEHKSPPLSPDFGQRRPSMDFRAQSTSRGEELATPISPILASSSIAERKEQRRRAALRLTKSTEGHQSPPKTLMLGKRNTSMDLTKDAAMQKPKE